MAAGDFWNYMWQRTKELSAVTRHERIVKSNLAAFSTRIALLMDLWENSDGSDASRELLYDRCDEEHVILRDYVSEWREDIVKIVPALDASIGEYLEPNPYDSYEDEDEHRQFAYDQNNDFCTELASALLDL